MSCALPANHEYIVALRRSGPVRDRVPVWSWLPGRGVRQATVAADVPLPTTLLPIAATSATAARFAEELEGVLRGARCPAPAAAAAVTVQVLKNGDWVDLARGPRLPPRLDLHFGWAVTDLVDAGRGVRLGHVQQKPDWPRDLALRSAKARAQALRAIFDLSLHSAFPSWTVRAADALVHGSERAAENEPSTRYYASERETATTLYLTAADLSDAALDSGLRAFVQREPANYEDGGFDESALAAIHGTLLGEASPRAFRSDVGVAVFCRAPHRKGGGGLPILCVADHDLDHASIFRRLALCAREQGFTEAIGSLANFRAHFPEREDLERSLVLPREDVTMSWAALEPAALVRLMLNRDLQDALLVVFCPPGGFFGEVYDDFTPDLARLVGEQTGLAVLASAFVNPNFRWRLLTKG